MCVIAVIPKDKKLSHELASNCFTNNPDGAGFMYSDGTKVYIKKGYMKFSQFWADFSKIPKNVNVVCHFRIATHGKVNAGNTHPFPLIGDIDKMQARTHCCKNGVAHNGIIPFCSPNKHLQSDYSDSMIFVSEHLFKMGGAWKKPSVRKMIQLATTSKFAIMTPEQVYMIGDFTEHDGMYFSNTSYNKQTYLYGGDEDYYYGGRWYNGYNTNNYINTWHKGYVWDRDKHIWVDPNAKKNLPVKIETDDKEHCLLFKTKAPTDYLARKILEEMEEKYDMFVEEYQLFQKTILFKTIGLPGDKTIKGHVWREVSNDLFKSLHHLTAEKEAEKETEDVTKNN